jgi:hypothetical protein
MKDPCFVWEWKDGVFSEGSCGRRGRLWSLSQAMKRRWEKIAIHVKRRKGLTKISENYYN